MPSLCYNTCPSRNLRYSMINYIDVIYLTIVMIPHMWGSMVSSATYFVNSMVKRHVRNCSRFLFMAKTYCRKYCDIPVIVTDLFRPLPTIMKWTFIVHQLHLPIVGIKVHIYEKSLCFGPASLGTIHPKQRLSHMIYDWLAAVLSAKQKSWEKLGIFNIEYC